jgi:hypothetical protein
VSEGDEPAEVGISELVEAGVLSKGELLKIRSRDDVRAKITSTGLRVTMKVGAFAFDSPSDAASAALMSTEPIDGWDAWKVRREGRWLSIGEVRRRFIERL